MRGEVWLGIAMVLVALAGLVRLCWPKKRRGAAQD